MSGKVKMARSKSSSRWLKEHFDDEYVRRAQKEGYRSRAVFKLEELNDKDHFIRHGMVVVDLGAAPGSWSQYAEKQVGDRGRVFALDILPMEPLADVEFLEGDFREQEVLDQLTRRLDDRKVDLVMSDMAPNISGMRAVDQPRVMHLAELALDFARENLVSDGVFLVKLFQGEGFDVYVQDLRTYFTKVNFRKPKASRPRSREVYALASGYNKQL